MKKSLRVGVGCVGIAAVLYVGLSIGVAMKGMSVSDLYTIGKCAVEAKASRHSVADRVAEIVAKKPQLKSVAEAAGGKLRILVFKNERRLEVHAPGWKAPRVYSMTGFSGTLGPKLKEGDGQIPEGVYGIEYLNPNSSYYLSMKVSYPNDADRRRAKADGRTNLGGDIMIHGTNATIGCVPIGDDAIEDVFYLVNAVGIKNVSVIIAPYDMRSGRKLELEKSPLSWYAELCNQLEEILTSAFTRRMSAREVSPNSSFPSAGRF